MPEPVPDPVTVIQEVLVDEAHVQPLWVVTLNVPVPPDAAGVRAIGLTTNEQAADCVTVKVLVAIVTIALRAAAVVFAATLKLTVPLAEPLAPPVTVTQLAPLVAVHAQPDVVVTAAVPVPAAAPNARLVGEMLNVQPAPACVTVKLRPAMVSVADRLVVAVLAATLNVTVPLVEPLDPPVTVTQLAPLVAVQGQPVIAVTATLPDPPAPAKACVDVEMPNVQLAPGCVTVTL